MAFRVLTKWNGRKLTKGCWLARKEARRLASLLKAKDPTIRTVYLFGSVTRGESGNSSFDLDLALDGGDLYAALDLTENSEFEVDLVELALLPPAMRESVLNTGISL